MVDVCAVMTAARDCFQLVLNVFRTIAMYIAAVRDAISFAVDTNYKVVSHIFNYVSSSVSAVAEVGNAVCNLVWHILQSWYEFLYEFAACLFSIGVFIGKSLVLAYKILCFIFSGVETAVMYILTGGYTTVATLRKSAGDIANSACILWTSGCEISQELVDAVVGGFSIIGNIAVGIVKGVWWSLGFTFASVLNILCSCFLHVYNIWNKVVSAATNALTLSQEVYLGVIVCCLIYLAISNFIFYIKSRGINFRQLWSRSRPRVRRPQYDFDAGFESDVEILDNENVEQEEAEDEQSDDNELETDDSDDAESENDVSDNDEDDDDDSDGSVNSQTFSSESDQDIEISLPEPSTERYPLRSRSSTPSRLKNLSCEEFVYEIEREKDKRKCVVCQDQNKCVLILPCRHMCLCVYCANQIVRARYAVRRVCPLCRQQIEKVMNVYV